MECPTAIVVGAGAGGVAVAARLAKRGFRVTVVEKNDYIGGRCSLLYDGAYRFDQGPSLLLMPEFFEEIFNDLSTSLDAEEVRLIKCDPNYRIWFPDQQTIDLSSDIVQMKRVIEQHEGGQGFERFLEFLVESGRHYRLSSIHVLGKNFPSLWSMLRPSLIRSLCKLHPFESMYHRVSRYFRSEKLRQAFTFASMYLGMNPFEAPGTYSLLQYTECTDGIWYPVGGFQTVLRALADIGSRFGVQYRLNCPVSSLVLSDDQKAVCGVTLESGEKLDANLVIVNADLVYSYSNLLPKSTYADHLKTRRTSCSSISFFWSFNTTIPGLQCHNVFLAGDYEKSFDTIFKQNQIPEKPSFYVNVPNHMDSTASPPGTDALVVLLPVNSLDESNLCPEYWNRLVSETRAFVMGKIEEHTGTFNLRESLIGERVETPLTWKEKYNLDRGAILGLSHSFFNVLSFRPKTRHPKINGLFFVGASTHPGTGVPVCLAGSKLVCSQVTQYWQHLNSEKLIWGPFYYWFFSGLAILIVFAVVLGINVRL